MSKKNINGRQWVEAGLDVALVAAAGFGVLGVAAAASGLWLAVYGGYKYLSQALSGNSRESVNHYARIKESQTGLPDVGSFNEHERLLLSRLVNPNDISTTLDDVYGMDELKVELSRELQALDALQDVVPMSKGILLHGPPGTGKTLLAKALAKQSGYWFLNVTASSIQSKWYGEANRFVAAVFSLARKLDRCVIFIDEVDALLNRRHVSGESEPSLQVKSEFLKLWDGLENDGSRRARVLVLGATNRLAALDPAATRRFSLRREVPLPDAVARNAILRGCLCSIARKLPTTGGSAVAGELLEGGALRHYVDATAGFSGCDLYNMCDRALRCALFELIQERHGELDHDCLAGIRLTEAHLRIALQELLAQQAAEQAKGS